MEWLKQQGPWCPALIEYLRRHHQQYDVLIFFTYLYAPTVLGLEVAPGAERPRVDGARRAGDPPRDLQGRVQPSRRRSCYHTESERQFVHDAVPGSAAARGDDRRRRRPPAAAAVPAHAGAAGRRRAGGRRGPTRPKPADAATRPAGARASRRICSRAASVFRRRHRLYGPIALYGGRIDPGKGCEELIEYFSGYVKEGGDAHARADGRQADVAARGAVHPLRRAAVGPRAAAGARGGHGRRRARRPTRACRCWRSRRCRSARPCSSTPAARCSSSTASRSNGGLFYADRDEFVECLKLLVARRRGCAPALGRNGREYVRQNYRWDVVLGKYERMFAKVRNAR